MLSTSRCSCICLTSCAIVTGGWWLSKRCAWSAATGNRCCPGRTALAASRSAAALHFELRGPTRAAGEETSGGVASPFSPQNSKSGSPSRRQRPAPTPHCILASSRTRVLFTHLACSYQGAVSRAARVSAVRVQPAAPPAAGACPLHRSHALSLRCSTRTAAREWTNASCGPSCTRTSRDLCHARLTPCSS